MRFVLPNDLIAGLKYTCSSRCQMGTMFPREFRKLGWIPGFLLRTVTAQERDRYGRSQRRMASETFFSLDRQAYSDLLRVL